MILLKFAGYLIIFISIIASFITFFGLMRFKDNYIQIHVSGINDMFAFPLLLLGTGFLYVSEYDFKAFFKLILVIILFYAINPITNYCMIKIVYFYRNKLKIKNKTTEKQKNHSY
jgi:monovalent cation/proton antiporter MnhG/PhaG subunit